MTDLSEVLAAVGRAKNTISVAWDGHQWSNSGHRPLWGAQNAWGLVLSTQPPFCRGCSLKRRVGHTDTSSDLLTPQEPNAGREGGTEYE
jgi:hypothetical protein